MPRGDNPNSRKNLVQNSGRSRKEVEKLNAKGGKASGKARRQYASFRAAFQDKTTDDDMSDVFEVVKRGAKHGNKYMIDIWLKLMGDDVNQVEIKNVSPEAIREVEEFIDGAECGKEETASEAENESG